MKKKIQIKETHEGKSKNEILNEKDNTQKYTKRRVVVTQWKDIIEIKAKITHSEYRRRRGKKINITKVK